MIRAVCIFTASLLSAACSSQIANPAETTIVVPASSDETVPGACAGIAEPESIGLAGPDGTFCVRPATLDGSAVVEAGSEAKYGTWSVFPLFAEGPQGIEGFNVMASECTDRSSLCPTGQIAVVVDNRVVAAPTVQQPAFDRDQIVVAGGFSELEARSVASLFTSPTDADRVGFHYVLVQTS